MTVIRVLLVNKNKSLCLRPYVTVRIEFAVEVLVVPCRITPIRSGPVEVCFFFPLNRIDQLSSSFFCIIQCFSSSFLSVSVGVFSCNKLRLLVCFFLLLFLWYGTPPKFSVCFAKGSLLDFLTGSGVLGCPIYRYIVRELSCFLLARAITRHQCLYARVFLQTCCSTRSRLRPIWCSGSSLFLCPCFCSWMWIVPCCSAAVFLASLSCFHGWLV